MNSKKKGEIFGQLWYKRSKPSLSRHKETDVVITDSSGSCIKCIINVKYTKHLLFPLFMLIHYSLDTYKAKICCGLYF